MPLPRQEVDATTPRYLRDTRAGRQFVDMAQERAEACRGHGSFPVADSLHGSCRWHGNRSPIFEIRGLSCFLEILFA